MTRHDQVRAERAARCDRDNEESILDAIGGIQSTDNPSLCSVEDQLWKDLRVLRSRKYPPEYMI